MRNWTYCDKIARNNLPLPCHVRIAAKPTKNQQGSFYKNFNNVSKHAENLHHLKNGIYSVDINYIKNHLFFQVIFKYFCIQIFRAISPF